MRAVKSLLITPAAKIAAGLLLLISVILTQVPLFNYLGLEFSVVMAVLAGYVLGLTVLSWRRGEEAADRWWRSLGEMIGASMVLLVLPLVVVTVNAIWVKNCAYGEGLLIYFLTTIPGVLFSVSMAIAVTSIWNKSRRSIFTVFFIVVLMHVAYVTLLRPQIFAFSPIVGFFPGITYDESLSFLDRLALYRVCTLSMVGLLLILARWVFLLKLSWRGGRKAGSARRRSRFPVLEMIVGGVSLVTAAIFAIWTPQFRLASTEQSIYDALGGRYESAHVIVYYPAELYTPQRVVRLALLHEFYILRLADVLQVRPTTKIVSFVYATPEQKQLLVGAGATDFAKPWLHQIHINAEDVETSLKHELVHVMAADFGIPILGIGRNQGVMEGLAMAEEGMAYGETLDELSAEMMALGMGKDVDHLFSYSGFAEAYPAVSYVLAGSFVQYLLRERGLPAFKRFYRGGDARAVYGEDLNDLIGNWRSSLAPVPSDSPRLRRAAYLFKRPSIFSKTCPRVIARLNDQTRSALQADDVEAARRSASKSLGLSPSPHAILQYASILLRLGRREEAVAFGESNLADTIWAQSVYPLHLIVGDALWQLSRPGEAAIHYAALQSLHLSQTLDEVTEVRMEALATNPGDTLIRAFLTQDVADSVMVDALRRQAVKPRRLAGLVRYRLGRRALVQHRSQQAIAYFETTGPLSGDVLEQTRENSLGLAYYRLGQYQKARVHFWLSLNFSSEIADQAVVEEWLDRCAWMEEWLGSDPPDDDDNVEG